MDIKFDLLMEKISEAEFVLVGIGEEWEISEKDFAETKQFQKAVHKFGDGKQIIPFVKKVLIENNLVKNIDLKNEFYQSLFRALENKNYFIVSLCTDGLIHKTGFLPDRIVEPCGNYRQLQCSHKCTTDLYEADSNLMKQIEAVMRDNFDEKGINMPVCPKCAYPLAFNTVSLGNDYLEEGYLEQWQIYTKWLQGTLNRKVCILELGAGMKFPTVIRWPFEKVTFFNKKASFFRVHSRLFQITEEIKERSCAIEASPKKFLKELSNRMDCDKLSLK